MMKFGELLGKLSLLLAPVLRKAKRTECKTDELVQEEPVWKQVSP